MNLKSPLLRGRFIRRYKRFFADVALDGGETVTAHCPNPGSMLGLAIPDAEAFVSLSDNPKRRLAHTLELVRVNGALVGINTIHPNRIVAEALDGGRLPTLAGYQTIRREVPYGEKSRIDFLLEHETRAPCYLEVKSVTLSRKSGLAEFPDCVTARGARHLAELAAMAEAGHRAVILFLVQRADCAHFRLAADLDPGYAAVFARAVAMGVEALCYACRVEPEAIALDKPLPISGL
jgi:sugar fermentation stimulation protein A